MYDSDMIKLDDLAGVVGGVNTDSDVDYAEKFKELKEAANKLNLNYTKHQLEAIADRWEENNFNPSAEDYLTGIKKGTY
ncbi:MAG: hypothetical protein K6C13_16060 [Oscillospiraceae bacterium]|nr:hypothetical protein [Oscillospiraceae bacterium]